MIYKGLHVSNVFGNMQTPEYHHHNHGSRHTKHLPKCLCILPPFLLLVLFYNTYHEIYPLKFLSAQYILVTIDTMSYSRSLELIHLA